MTELIKMNLESEDLVAERIAQMKALFPEITTEGDGSIDFEKLRLVLGEEVMEGDERYAFTWPGKRDAIRLSQTPSTATLRPCPEKSVSWDTTENLYIEGDNLEVLKLLQHSYHGKVKMIYIDPPYNTGHDFVYKDKFGDTIENYKEQASLSGQSNADTSGRYHSDWCSMIYPRLKLARELLTEDGVIFISIDDNESRNLRAICDEVFGEDNRIGPIIQNKMNAKNDTVDVQKNHEYIMIYRKACRLSGGKEMATLENVQVKEREVFIDNGKYYYLNDPITTRGEGGTLNARPNLGYTVYYNSKTKDKIAVADFDIIKAKSAKLENEIYTTDNSLLASGYTPIRPPKVRGLLGCWTWDINKFNNQKNEIIITGKPGSYIVRKRTFVDATQCVHENGRIYYYENKSSNTRSILDYSTNEGTKVLSTLYGFSGIFDNPKNVDMLEYLIALVPGNNFKILDFFSGSATSAQAAFQANMRDGGSRQILSVQLPETTKHDSPAFQAGFSSICEVGEERIRRVGAKIAAEVEESNRQLKPGEEPKPVPDIGFRVLSLDESGINKPEEMTLVNNVVKEDRTDQDIIFEMMLKWGLELTLPIEQIKAAKYPCYSVAAGELICCMTDGLSSEALQAIADCEPRRVFVLDSILTDTLKLNAAQIFKRASGKTGMDIELRTV